MELYTKGNTTTKQIQEAVGATETLCHATIGKLEENFNRLTRSMPPSMILNNPHIQSMQESFKTAQSLFHDLQTEHQRTTFLTSKGLILPTAYRIGTRINTNPDGTTNEATVYAQYVSIIQTLKAKYASHSPSPMVSVTSMRGEISNFESTLTYKNSEFFQSHPEAFKLILYHDDIEVANPLGSRAGVHKLTMFYISVHGHTSGKLNDIHLLVVCHASDIKTYGYSSILRPFIDDLIRLNAGVLIPGQQLPIFARLTHIVGDNLAANQILGMVCSFTHGYHCRFCYVKGDEYRNAPPQPYQLLRSATSHTFDVERAKHDDAAFKVSGVKHECVLDDLPYFSGIEATVPDIM